MYLDEFPITVRIKVNGIFTNKAATIDLRNPDKQDNVGFGTARSYPESVSTKKNSNGEKYAYADVSMDATWNATVVNGGGVVGKADLERYWDWVYSNYTKDSAVDFEKNCHGYSFGVGDWPNTAIRLLALGPYGMNSAKNPLYQSTSLKLVSTAKIAADINPTAQGVNIAGLAHSVKVDGTVATLLSTQTERHVLVGTSEKFRESGVYSQSSQFPTWVTVANSKKTSHLNFGLFEPYNGGGGKGSRP